MSLIGFHKVLIGTAILFCAGFALHQAAEFRVSGGGLALLTAAMFAIAAVGLGVYLAHMRAVLKLPAHPPARPAGGPTTNQPEHTSKNGRERAR